jgi:hypothetical protein
MGLASGEVVGKWGVEHGRGMASGTRVKLDGRRVDESLGGGGGAERDGATRDDGGSARPGPEYYRRRGGFFTGDGETRRPHVHLGASAALDAGVTLGKDRRALFFIGHMPVLVSCFF